MLLTKRFSTWLEAIQHGFVLTLPVVMLGAFALTLLQIPHLFNHAFEDSLLLQVATWVLQGSYGIMALTLVLSISYRLADKSQKKLNLSLDPMVPALLAMATFITFIFLEFNQNTLAHLGVTSVAKAIVSAIVFNELFIFFFCHRIVKLGFLQNDVDSNMHQALAAIYPAILAPFIMVIIYAYGFSDWYPLKNLLPVIVGSVNESVGLSYFQSITLVCINQMLWFVGIHGSSLLELNAELIYMQGQGVLYSRQFLDLYAHMGGGGATLGLIIALLCSAKSDDRKLAKYALLPGIFNINELLIFGLPIVLNRFLFLPFLLAPIVSISIARLAIELGLVTLDGVNTSWNTPVLLSGYLASGQISGAVVQLIGVLLSACLYWPFVKRFNADQRLRHEQKLKSMIHTLGQPNFDMKKAMGARNNLGSLCRRLDNDMRKQLDEGCFAMHYQPKMNRQGQVASVEALIRWQHKELSSLPPCVFIQIAEATGFIRQLGRWIIETCLKDMKDMEKAGMPALQVAINVSPIQLHELSFFDYLPKKVKQYGIQASLIELEITEGQELLMSDDLFNGLKNLSLQGFSIALDDFGMGYTSLRYLQTLNLDTLKLDGSLVKDVTQSEVVRDIIRSMSSLTQNRGVKLVAEWVTNKAQYELLIELGCDQFQGQLFSMPVDIYDLISFCVKHSSAQQSG